jgi:hypothetical protein
MIAFEIATSVDDCLEVFEAVKTGRRLKGILIPQSIEKVLASPPGFEPGLPG